MILTSTFPSRGWDTKFFLGHFWVLNKECATTLKSVGSRRVAFQCLENRVKRASIKPCITQVSENLRLETKLSDAPENNG